ncbi:MAG: LemA family protein [Bacteroidetes bacterium]|nr:LemA family protein [Bacteroidota bacterium]
MNEIIFILVFLIFIIYITSIYNRVIRRKNETDKAFGSVELLLKKRYDLLPNLVEIAKNYAFYESSVLTGITELNNAIGSDKNNNGKIELYNTLNKELQGILLKSANLPELKASEHFLKIQAVWNETEEQISAARRYFNSAVSDYNNAIQTFPANFIINNSKFPEKKYLEFDKATEETPLAGNLFKG